MDKLTSNNHILTSTNREEPVATDRRRVLRWGGAAVLAGAAAAATRPTTAAAAPAAGPHVTTTDDDDPTLELRQLGRGDALYVHVDKGSNSNRAIFGRTFGTGIAVVAAIANPDSRATAAKGTTIGSGAGVEGQSVYGVGGRFAGRTAQVHLVPSPASSHPDRGAAGQLFVDRANRLWCCRGGTNWAQLA
jgi:hypothetical protein